MQSRTFLRLALVAFVGCSVIPRVWAQPPLTIEASVRAFGGREGIPYGAFTLQREAWTLRGVASNKTISNRPNQTPLLHGGGDLELARTFTLPMDVEAQLGAAFSDTAAQPRKLHLTTRLRYERAVAEKVTLSLEPRGVFGHTTLVGVSLGARAQLDKKSAFLAELTPMLYGRNASAGSTGAATQRALWELGVSRQEGCKTITLGVTNALGPTTGFSLSPSLSGSALVLKVRFTR